MSMYSLKQFLLESDKAPVAKSCTIDHLIGGMQKVKKLNENVNVPISPQGTGWEQLTDPNRLRREFKVEEVCSRRIFINDILNLADESMHHIEVRILSDRIFVELYTEDLNDITNMDFEYAKDIDEIYVDAMFSCNNQNLGDTNDLW